MKKEWLKKITLAVMVSVALGMSACGASTEGDSEEEFLEFAEEGNQGGNQGNDDEGSVQFFDGGSITSTDDFISVTTNDGGSFFID